MPLKLNNLFIGITLFRGLVGQMTQIDGLFYLLDRIYIELKAFVLLG